MYRKVRKMTSETRIKSIAFQPEDFNVSKTSKKSFSKQKTLPNEILKLHRQTAVLLCLVIFNQHSVLFTGVSDDDDNSSCDVIGPHDRDSVVVRMRHRELPLCHV